MISFDATSGTISPKYMGRIAASYYLSCDTMEIFNAALHPTCTEADILSIVVQGREFE